MSEKNVCGLNISVNDSPVTSSVKIDETLCNSQCNLVPDAPIHLLLGAYINQTMFSNLDDNHKGMHARVMEEESLL